MVTAADIQAGLERNEFFLEYQPVVSVADGRCVGCEALLRWRHELHGPLPPGEFIGVGEGIDDLRPFDPKAFAEGLFEEDTDED